MPQVLAGNPLYQFSAAGAGNRELIARFSNYDPCLVESHACFETQPIICYALQLSFYCSHPVQKQVQQSLIQHMILLHP